MVLITTTSVLYAPQQHSIRKPAQQPSVVPPPPTPPRPPPHPPFTLQSFLLQLAADRPFNNGSPAACFQQVCLA